MHLAVRGVVSSFAAAPLQHGNARLEEECSERLLGVGERALHKHHTLGQHARRVPSVPNHSKQHEGRRCGTPQELASYTAIRCRFLLLLHDTKVRFFSLFSLVLFSLFLFFRTTPLYSV